MPRPPTVFCAQPDLTLDVPCRQHGSHKLGELSRPRWEPWKDIGVIVGECPETDPRTGLRSTLMIEVE